MKIKYLLISLIVALSAILSFADDNSLSYYTISPEKVEAYAEQDLLKDSTKVFHQAPPVHSDTEGKSPLHQVLPSCTEGISSLQAPHPVV